MLAHLTRTRTRASARSALAAALHGTRRVGRGPADTPPPAGDDATDQFPATPWVRSVISGVDLMRNPK